MAMWNPWRGCKKCSEGCRYCYIHKGDAKRGVDTSIIEKTKDFAKPIERLKNGNYKMKSSIVYTCFSTDFLIEEADGWRSECWQMIKEREDCTFLFLNVSSNCSFFNPFISVDAQAREECRECICKPLVYNTISKRLVFFKKHTPK